jgi:hypothetical protein
MDVPLSTAILYLKHNNNIFKNILMSAHKSFLSDQMD